MTAPRSPHPVILELEAQGWRQLGPELAELEIHAGRLEVERKGDRLTIRWRASVGLGELLDRLGLRAPCPSQASVSVRLVKDPSDSAGRVWRALAQLGEPVQVGAAARRRALVARESIPQ